MYDATTDDETAGTGHPGYVALLAAAADLRPHGYLVRFAADLTRHDRLALARLATDVPFVWGVRADGTTLLTRATYHAPYQGPAWPQVARAWLDDLLPDHAVYGWTGTVLRRLPDPAAVAEFFGTYIAARDLRAGA